MSENPSRPNYEGILKLILQIVGAISLFALIFVAAPYSWMNAIHDWLGLGALPGEPVVGYLARSTSAFYATVGGLLLLLSTDIPRFRPIIAYVGWFFAVFGVVLTLIGVFERLPWWWIVNEGPFSTVYGAAILVLLRKIDNADVQTS